jgi:hypothetical protein
VTDWSTLALAHHWPDQYRRCAVVRGRRVCRRCLALYPLAFASMLASLAGLGLPPRYDVWVAWLLPLPCVVELVAEAVGWVRYSPRRQVLLTIPLAVALGRGLARYLEAPSDRLFWAVALLYGALAGGATAYGWWRAVSGGAARAEAG